MIAKLSVVGATCCLRCPVVAAEVCTFQETLTGLNEDQQRCLLGAMVALNEMPGDASLERQVLLNVIMKLRDEWKRR